MLKLRLRWKFFLFLLVFSLVPLVVVTMISQRGTRRLGRSISEDMRQNLTILTSETLQQTAESASKTLLYATRAVMSDLMVLAHEAERAFMDAPLPESKIYFESDFNDPATAPPDFGPSPGYQKKSRDGSISSLSVSFDQPVFLKVKGVSGESIASDLKHLPRLIPVFRNLSEKLGRMIYWAYVSTESGLHISYPGHGGYPSNYDPRKRPWYKEATNQLHFTFPLIDATTGLAIMTVSKRIKHPDGSFAGVVGMDILITELLQIEQLKSLWSSQMHSLLVTTEQNPETNAPGLLVLAQKDYQNKSESWSGVIEREWLTSKDSEKLAELYSHLRQGKTGYMELHYKGVDSIWAYAGFTERAHFVIIVPRTVIKELPEKTSRNILHYTREQLVYTAIAALVVIGLLAAAALIGSRTITRSLLQIAAAAKRLSGGDFSVRLNVRTGDERDQVIQAVNEIGPKLEDHLRIHNSLQLAMEVQRSLLPHEDPHIAGLDVAGTSIYCDETGGDYYDYLHDNDHQLGQAALVVGDISGHGLPSALLMASARALLRQRTSLAGSIGDIVTDVNHQLTVDMADSGSFMTLFYFWIDARSRKIKWVRAGHDPAIFYDPGTDAFEELAGKGIALGIDEDWTYEENVKSDLTNGQIILIGTDGIWETKNAKDQMFGKEPIYEIIRNKSAAGANEIMNAVISALNLFRGDLAAEDDVTLMVIKVKNHQ